MVGESLDNANLTENCVKIVVSEKIDSKFLYYYLKSPIGQAEITRGTVGRFKPSCQLKIYKILVCGSLGKIFKQRLLLCCLVLTTKSN